MTGSVGERVPHGGAPAGYLDLSANLNPLGTPPAVAAAVAAAEYGRYADLKPEPAVNRLADDTGIERDRIVLTAGATEGLRLAIAELAGGNHDVLIVGPAYGEYRRLAAEAAARVAEVRAADPQFLPPLAEAIDAIRSLRPALVVICDPNNPTGRGLARDDVTALLAVVGRGRVLVDDSFGPFRSADASFPLDDERVVVVRSLTKLHAIPGVRVGYLVAAPAVAERLRVRQDPWTVGSHAIAAAAAGGWGLGDDDRAKIGVWREALAGELRRHGLEPVPSVTNFSLVAAGADADALVAGLAEWRVAVRPCASFRLPRFVRLAVPDPAGLAQLAAALEGLRDRVA